MLCAEEAEEFQADDDFEPSPEPPAGPPTVRPVTATDIRIKGDTATAAVSRQGQQDVTLSFRKENGTMIARRYESYRRMRRRYEELIEARGPRQRSRR